MRIDLPLCRWICVNVFLCTRSICPNQCAGPHSSLEVKAVLGLYCISPNKVNHFTTTLYPRDLLNIPPKLWTVQFYSSLPENTLVTKYVPMLLWLDCGLWQCRMPCRIVFCLACVIAPECNSSIQSTAALHCICTFSLPVQMPHLAKVGVCWQAAHEGRTSYWILGSPPPLGESGIRYNLRVSENFCDPQYQGQEIKWNYVTLPTYAAKSKNTKKSAASRSPPPSLCNDDLCYR